MSMHINSQYYGIVFNISTVSTHAYLSPARHFSTDALMKFTVFTKINFYTEIHAVYHHPKPKLTLDAVRLCKSFWLM